MAVRPIRILGRPGDEVLRRQAAAIEQIDGSVQTLIDDMIDTVRAAPGLGLAAPQVGVSLRLVVINVPEVPAFALINADVVRHSGRRWVEEGCLSIPGYRGDLYRSVRVTVSGLDRFGRRIRVRAVDDIMAQALEHEIDHTNGLLYVDLLRGDQHLHTWPREPDEPVEYPPEHRAGSEPAELPLALYRQAKRRGRPPLITRPRRLLRGRPEQMDAAARGRLRYRA
jgi:peptide deformylase